VTWSVATKCAIDISKIGEQGHAIEFASGHRKSVERLPFPNAAKQVLNGCRIYANLVGGFVFEPVSLCGRWVCPVLTGKARREDNHSRHMYIVIYLKIYKFKKLEGCFTVHLPHEIKWNANLMQLGNVYWCILNSTCFEYIRPSSEGLDVELQHTVYCTEFLDGWWSWEPMRRSCVRCGWFSASQQL